MSSAAEGISVSSVTGIDVSLPLAGPGARALGFLIDWQIRLVLALAWYVSGALLYNGRFSLLPPLINEARWFGFIVAPALALYFLYHPVLEVLLRGVTPGKRAARVRLVTRLGATPGASALLVRNVFRLIDSLPAFYGVGLLTVMFSRDQVRFGDMAAGTLLVYDHSHLGEALAPAPPGGALLDAAAAELVSELLLRWPQLASESRVRLARQVLQRFGGEPVAPELGEEALHERLAALARAH